jgi:NaMN:DMB phosphoribosyltransferase
VLFRSRSSDLDGEASGAAALVAARLAPAVTGYLIAAQHGQGCMPAIVAALGLEPVFAGEVGHGEGAGAAMVLGLLDQVLAPWRGGGGGDAVEAGLTGRDGGPQGRGES